VWFVNDAGDPVGVEGRQKIPIKPGNSANVVVTAPARPIYDGPLRLLMGWLDELSADGAERTKRSTLDAPRLYVVSAAPHPTSPPGDEHQR